VAKIGSFPTGPRSQYVAGRYNQSHECKSRIWTPLSTATGSGRTSAVTCYRSWKLVCHGNSFPCFFIYRLLSEIFCTFPFFFRINFYLSSTCSKRSPSEWLCAKVSCKSTLEPVPLSQPTIQSSPTRSCSFVALYTILLSTYQLLLAHICPHEISIRYLGFYSYRSRADPSLYSKVLLCLELTTFDFFNDSLLSGAKP